MAPEQKPKEDGRERSARLLRALRAEARPVTYPESMAPEDLIREDRDR